MNSRDELAFANAISGPSCGINQSDFITIKKEAQILKMPLYQVKNILQIKFKIYPRDVDLKKSILGGSLLRSQSKSRRSELGKLKKSSFHGISGIIFCLPCNDIFAK